MDTDSRSSDCLKMQGVRTWVNRNSTDCHIIVNFSYAVLLEDFLCSDLQPKHYRRVQQKIQLFLGDGKPEDSYYWKGP